MTVARVGSLDEAIAEANAPAYGLTAGIYTEDEAEQEQHRAEAVVEVEELVPVDVSNALALASGQIDRPRLTGLKRRGDPARQDPPRAPEHRRRPSSSAADSRPLSWRIRRRSSIRPAFLRRSG